MPSSKTVAMIMAGGQGSRLSVLSELRAKPAMPFAGKYRIIDFTISNVMHSRIPWVGICTQYRPFSLMKHISNGEGWGYGGRGRQLQILPPFQGVDSSDWYAGTADAIYQNLGFIESFDGIEHVLILSGDHIYRMDYNEMLRNHVERDADLTIVTQEIPWEETSRFGIVVVKEHDYIIGFQEKPKENPASNLANLGIYIFKKSVLVQRLHEDAARENSRRDFGGDVIPNMVERGDVVCAYRFRGYWRDVGTVHAYWQTNLDVIDPERTGLDLHNWGTRTNPWAQALEVQLPARVFPTGRITHSLISQGCSIEGEVRDSVLSPGVVVRQGARVERCVVLNGAQIGPGALVCDAVIDKRARIGAGTVIGVGDNAPNSVKPDILNQGVTLVGKQAVVPEGLKIGRNCLIDPEAAPDDFLLDRYISGSTIFGKC